MSQHSTDLHGRTAIVTGAGAGLGRAEALALAGAGANVVVNDVGESAAQTADDIRALGGRAMALPGDIGDWRFAEALARFAVASFGSLEIVINNAGITRDAMLFNLSESDWDDVVRVHLKGHAALSRAAAALWRETAKRAGAPVYGRLVNTSSEAFLLGGPGQANYAAAKAGITALTLSSARGLGRYGVTANAICPRARTAMTRDVFPAPDCGSPDAGRPDPLAPERVAVFVAYLASPAAASINGQVFVVHGDMVALLAPATVEHRFVAQHGAFAPDELARTLTPYFADRDPDRMFAAWSVTQTTDDAARP